MTPTTINGKPLAEFLADRGIALFDGVLAAAAFLLLVLGYKWLSKATFLVRLSLRTRITIAFVALALICVVGLWRGVDAWILVVFAVGSTFATVWWILNDLSKIGIINAFQTTKQGLSAERTLKEVRRELVFLGTGAKKLTSSSEFDTMLVRCRDAGGSLRFLLSSPENPALEQMAQQNNHNNLSYRSRVKESIREIFTRASRTNVKFEVRLYKLDQKVALPHIRLMFIDGRMCVFSQLRWTENEGLDNPQLILRPNKDQATSSLYQGYRNYFDDLWDHPATVVVDQAMLDSWPA